MSTLLDAPDPQASTSPSERIRAAMAPARVSIHWFGVRKSLNSQQTAQAADAFGAEDRFLSAAKKLLDTTHPAFKAVTSVRSRVQRYWKGVSLPYPEPGIRLIRRDQVEEFASQMQWFQEELEESVATLNDHFSELEAATREKLGHLYDPRDYPESLVNLFRIGFDFPSVEPPNYLQQLNPELYQQECDRVQQRFNEAVTARDRDRLRQDVLESLGWKMVRIWSTDWVRNPDRQIQRVLSRYEQALSSFTEDYEETSTPNTDESRNIEMPIITTPGHDHPQNGLQEYYYDSIENVPDSIILSIATDLLRAYGATDEDELIKSVTKSLGFGRTGKHIFKRIKRCVDELKNTGTLTGNDEGVLSLG